MIQDGGGKIRANPRPLTLNGVPATFEIAKEQYVSVVTGPVSYPYTKIKVIQVGIVLTVTPYIAHTGEVTLQVEAVVGDVVGVGPEGLPLVD